MNFPWHKEGTPPKQQIVLIAIAQPETLTSPEDEPTPVWVGYWNGSEWLTANGESVEVIAWMELPVAPIAALGETYIEGQEPPKAEFHVEPITVEGVGKFFGVYCGEQLLAVRGNQMNAQGLAQNIQTEVAK